MTNRDRRKGLVKPGPQGTLAEQNCFYARLEKREHEYRVNEALDRAAFELQGLNFDGAVRVRADQMMKENSQ